MNLSEQEKQELAQICAAHSTNIRDAVLAAYEKGVLAGALRAAQAIAAKGLAAPSGSAGSSGDDGDDDEGTGPMTSGDLAWLKSKGIDPSKKFRIRNSLFTITGVKASRWKYPISASTQNGTRYKFTIDQVRGHQSRS